MIVEVERAAAGYRQVAIRLQVTVLKQCRGVVYRHLPIVTTASRCPTQYFKRRAQARRVQRHAALSFQQATAARSNRAVVLHGGVADSKRIRQGERRAAVNRDSVRPADNCIRSRCNGGRVDYMQGDIVRTRWAIGARAGDVLCRATCGRDSVETKFAARRAAGHRAVVGKSRALKEEELISEVQRAVVR